MTLTADAGSSGINCSLSQSQGTPDFSSVLTINVPSNVNTGKYQIRIVASNGPVTHEVSYSVSVLGSEVQVSGSIYVGSMASAAQIKFTDQQTGQVQTVSVTSSNYCVMLENEHTYNVYITTVGHWFNEEGGYNAGSLRVYGPPGLAAMFQSFTESGVS